ncbi:hypothetical protein AR685_01700 [Chryseobacterium sp. JAH]|nr:hypothetical protein AR685_01700 [Chryseobacterium sp. JAH]
MAICLISCVSTKVSSKNNYDYSVLNESTNYIVETKTGEKIRHFQFNSQNDDLIIGKQGEKEIQIKKITIDNIKRPSTGKTIGLVAGLIALGAVGGTIPAAVSNN